MIMNKLLTGAMAAASLLTLLSACSDTFDPSSTSDRQGTLLLSVDLDKEVYAPKAMSKAATDADAIQASDLKLRLTSSNGQQWTWNSIDEMQPAQYNVGDYTFEAYYGDAAEEGFGKPYYYGSSSITLLENRSTPVSVTATLANSMVTVACSDEAKAFFSSLAISVTSSTGATHTYPLDETAPLYIAPGATTVSVDVELQDGTKAKLSPVTFDAKPRNSYAVAFTVNGGETGKAQLNVTFNSHLDEETVEIDLSKEILTAPAPTIETKGFTSGDRFDFIESTLPTQKYQAVISANGNVGTAVLTTSSASLLAQGWPAVVDFATADAATLAKLSELGLKYNGLTGKLSRMAVVDFTDVISHIAYVEGADNVTTFNLVAKDAATKESNHVAISFGIERIELTLTSYEFSPADNRLTIDATYNGGDLAEAVSNGDVSFLLINERGTYDVVAPISITAASRAAAAYTIVLPTREEGDVTFKVKYNGSTETAPVTLERRDLDAQVNVSANDVFATRATLTLTGNEADPSKARVFVSTDGKTYSEVSATNNSGRLALSGLKAATAYSVRVRINGLTSQPATFTTESAIQLPNGDMETWYKVNGKSKYWWTEYPGADANAVWGTMNALTTSQGGSYGAPGASYSAFSGTRQTSDKHSGNLAAVISTVGWGDGNTAWLNKIGSGISGGKCEHLTVGELYLGHYDSSSQKAVYDGINFASRPSGMTFYHKYTKKNSADWGVAEVRVLDASGNTIASGEARLEASAYTSTNISLTYADGAAKASKIVVVFKSSGNTDCHAINNNNLSSPPSANLTDGRYTGSELYIDDIVLNY